MSVPFREHKGRENISPLLPQWQRVRARAGRCRRSRQRSRLLRALWIRRLRRWLIPINLAGRPTSCNICKMLWWRPCGSINLLGLSTSLLMQLNWICRYVSVSSIWPSFVLVRSVLGLLRVEISVPGMVLGSASDFMCSKRGFSALIQNKKMTLHSPAASPG